MGKFLGDAASDAYGLLGPGDQIQSFIPRSKFAFTVDLTFRKPEAPSGLETIRLNRIAGISQPSYTPRTQVLNQYNRKRIVQTGLDYNPITLTAYDTRDALIEKLLKSYSAFYFNGPMNASKDEASFNQELVNMQFSGGNSRHGLRVQGHRQFITRIIIRKESSADDVNVTTIYNPMITSIAVDDLNYSDSNPIQYTIGFAYEGYDVTTGVS